VALSFLCGGSSSEPFAICRPEAPRCRNCLPGDAPPQDGLTSGGLTESPALNRESEEQELYATMRRYEGVDESRSVEITDKANENLIPRLSELPGFGFTGYFLFEPANGVLTSTSLFETSSHLDESNRVAAKVLQQENLQPVMPNPPMQRSPPASSWRTSPSSSASNRFEPNVTRRPACGPSLLARRLVAYLKTRK
jgi:hypothetical protein